ncbi:hypothetical protein ISP15_16085 [Dyella jejuensis]|uniref:Uncharacterized protein n=1 Tax=Dyella jejuensis TaxID=1432009 RepID=A0ABW8JLL0_9GAMM
MANDFGRIGILALISSSPTVIIFISSRLVEDGPLVAIHAISYIVSVFLMIYMARNRRFENSIYLILFVFTTIAATMSARFAISLLGNSLARLGKIDFIFLVSSGTFSLLSIWHLIYLYNIYDKNLTALKIYGWISVAMIGVISLIIIMIPPLPMII